MNDLECRAAARADAHASIERDTAEITVIGEEKVQHVPRYVLEPLSPELNVHWTHALMLILNIFDNTIIQPSSGFGQKNVCSIQ
jgi:hypothetical protein